MRHWVVEVGRFGIQEGVGLACLCDSACDEQLSEHNRQPRFPS